MLPSRSAPCLVSPKKFSPSAKMTSRNFLPRLSSFRPQLINQRAVILGDKNSFSFAWPYFVFPLFPVNGIFCLCLALPFSPSECFDSVFSCPGRKYIFLLPFSSPFLFISTYSLTFCFDSFSCLFRLIFKREKESFFFGT